MPNHAAAHSKAVDPQFGLTVLLLLLLAAAPALGQSSSEPTESTLAAELVDCVALDDKTERLACYDELAKPLAAVGAEAGSADPSVVQTFSGKDDWDSETFEVGRPWRAIWEIEGNILNVELLDSEGTLIDVIGQQIGEGGGRSEPQEPGTYRLGVRGLGAWRVRIVAID
ncbi:MAG: hypothetical protein ACREDZ_14915 [Kiloniellales bacterium]